MRVLLFLAFRKITHFLSGKGLGKIFAVVKVYNLLDQYLTPKGVILTKVQNHKMYVDSQDMGVGFPVLMDGCYCYEKYETELFKKIVKREW